MLNWNDVENFPIVGPVDERYVQDFVAWQRTYSPLKDIVENCARLRAIEQAGLKEYYQELHRPQVEELHERRSQRQQAWLESEERSWLRGYLLTHADGSEEEIEALVQEECFWAMRHPHHSRERMANWLWGTRHYFDATTDLGTTLELGALAQQVEAQWNARDK